MTNKNNRISNWVFPKPIYDELTRLRNLVFDPCGFKYSDPLLEEESIEYGACSITVNALQAKFRVAKITPTKVGQFVTLWKRLNNGPIQPYDINDVVDLFIISVRQGEHWGQFIFPQLILYKHGVLSNNGVGGKRAMRIYPPWDNPENKQARSTQSWQLEYFLDLSKSDQAINYKRAHILYRVK